MQRQIGRGKVLSATLLLGTLTAVASAQTSKPAVIHRDASAAVTVDPSGADAGAIQQQLLKLLKLSPTLTTVVARDPSLLADKEYVSRNNPELAQFLTAHPEVARNPSFYLFSNLPKARGEGNDHALERQIWPDLVSQPQQQPWESPASPTRALTPTERLVDNVGPFFFFVCVVGSLLWLIRMLMENRRWSRIFKLQTEVHSKLIDRFGNNQELLTYMDTEAGKRFLEAAPIPVDFDRTQSLPGPMAKIQMPLQTGIVLTLLGIGMLSLRHSVADLGVAMLVFGMMVLMPGLGFILSAGITWFLAVRLGMAPGPQRDGREQ